MTSEFGGDIFDDDPPSAAPPKKGSGSKDRSPSVQKVHVKARSRSPSADDDLMFPAAADTPLSASPRDESPRPSPRGAEPRAERDQGPRRGRDAAPGADAPPRDESRPEPRRDGGRSEGGPRDRGRDRDRGRPAEPRGEQQRPPRPDFQRDEAPRQDTPRPDGPRPDGPRHGGPRRDAPRHEQPSEPVGRDEVPVTDAFVGDRRGRGPEGPRDHRDERPARPARHDRPARHEGHRRPDQRDRGPRRDAPRDEFGASEYTPPPAREEFVEPPEPDVPASVEDPDDEPLFEPTEAVEGSDEDVGEGAGRSFGDGPRRRRRRRGRDRGFERGEREPRGPTPEQTRTAPVQAPAEPPTPAPQRPTFDREPRGPRHGERPTERQAEPEARPSWTPAGPSAGSRPTATTQRIAVFLDVEALQREARAIGGQVSFSRALRQIAGTRTVARAVAYCTPQSRGTGGAGGLESVRVDRDADTPVAIAVDALATAARVDCVVIAPESAAPAPLVRALRAHGVRVESAGFEARGQSEVADHQRLGKEALFVP